MTGTEAAGLPRARGPRAGTSLYRYGVRDDPDVRTEHSDASREWRRRIADALFPEHVRTAILTAVAAGATLADATEAVNVSINQTRGLAPRDADWAAQLDKALRAGADPDTLHGTPSGYRHWGCRCSLCYEAHHGGDGPRPSRRG